VARVVDKGKDTILKGTEGPRARFMNAIERDLRRFVPGDSATAPPETQQTPQTAPETSQQAALTTSQKTATTSRPNGASIAPAKIQPYITVGSTKDEVLAQQGTPTASTDDKLVYGKSELYLKDGSVIGWRIDPTSPIRVKLWPSTAVDPSLASYSIGSTKDVVLTVQGTPTAFTSDRYEYGKSIVNFRNNKVVSWKEDPDSTPLWAR
jgi:outer membrane protein assembly factor BamE (lipoprotein component of BamABCDE complex)